MKKLINFIFAYILLTGLANADQINFNNFELYGSPQVVNITSEFGPETVYANPQTGGAGSSSVFLNVPVFCVDIGHDNYLGGSYGLTPDQNLFTGEVENKLAWLSYQTGDLPAIQLAVWAIYDPAFAVTNFYGNTALQADYNNLVNEANNITGNYSADFFLADHVGNANQNLMVSVPEPSSLLQLLIFLILACAAIEHNARTF